MKCLYAIAFLALAACAGVAPQQANWQIEPRMTVQDASKDYRRQHEIALHLAAEGRYIEAIAHFRAAAALAPENAYLHNNLGYAYLLSGANDKAAQAFEQALAREPDYAKAKENLQLARDRLAPAPPRELASARAADPVVPLLQVAPNVYELKVPVRDMPKRAPARKPRLEVVNGNGAPGMAKRVAAALGVRARLCNERPFQRAATEIQYRDGYAEAAALISQRLEGAVRAVRVDGLEARGIDVRLVLGKDRVGSTTGERVAHIERSMASSQ